MKRDRPNFQLSGGLNLTLEGLYYGNNGGFINPIGVAVSREGYIYVTDSGRHQIAVLDKRGNEIKRIGSFGKEIGKLSYPASIIITSEPSQRLIVSEFGNNRIQVFDLKGKSLGLFPFKSNLPVAPTAIAMDNDQNFYVVDKSKQEILVYSSQGKYLKTIGKNLQERFNYPMGIAITPHGQIIVSDSGNAALKMIDQQGYLIKRIPEKNDDGLFNNPRGVTMDKDGNLYITDALKGLIMVLDPKGNFVDSLNVPPQYTNMNMPDGIIWCEDNLYLIDKGNGRLIKYSTNQ